MPSVLNNNLFLSYMKNIILVICLLFFYYDIFSQRVYKKPQFVKNCSKPTKHPDHIVLNFSDDPSSSISVTWRTSKDVKIAYGEIAIANENPAFISTANTIKATTTNFVFENVVEAFFSQLSEALGSLLLSAIRIGACG